MGAVEMTYCSEWWCGQPYCTFSLESISLFGETIKRHCQSLLARESGKYWVTAIAIKQLHQRGSGMRGQGEVFSVCLFLTLTLSLSLFLFPFWHCCSFSAWMLEAGLVLPLLPLVAKHRGILAAAVGGGDSVLGFTQCSSRVVQAYMLCLSQCSSTVVYMLYLVVYMLYFIGHTHIQGVAKCFRAWLQQCSSI